MASIQDEGGAHLGRHPFERPVELFETLVGAGLQHGIGVGCGVYARQHPRDLDRRGYCRLAQGVLLGHVLGNGEQVSLRGADGLVAGDAQHAQKDLLHDIRHIRRVTHAGHQEAAQLLPMGSREFGYQGLGVIGAQGRFQRRGLLVTIKERWQRSFYTPLPIFFRFGARQYPLARQSTSRGSQPAPMPPGRITLARQAAHGELGHLSIGYNTPAEFRVFPKIVPEFKKKWPNVHLTFHNLNITQQLEGVRRDELDLGFVWLPIPMQEFDVQELTHETLVAVVPSEHRLASAPSVSANDLSREPLILPTRLMDSETYRQIEQLFGREGAVINVAYELETLISVLNFVAMGSACSILADYTRRIRQDGVIYKPLRPSDIVKTLGMIKRKGRGDLAEAFYRFTADRFRDDGSPTR